MRHRITAVITVAMLSLGLTATAASAQSTGKLLLTTLDWSQPKVDASGGGAVVNLKWTIRDLNGSATDVAGAVDVQMAGSSPGSYIGRVYEFTYDLNNTLTGRNVVNTSGTAQDATFSYLFTVPQYANATKAQWVVTKVTAKDDQGESLSVSGDLLSDFDSVLTATEFVDSTAPTYGSLSFATPGQRPYVYDGGTSGSMSYYLEVTDPESGFWRGSIQLQGTGGQTADADFAFSYSLAEGTGYCGSEFSPWDNDVLCVVTVTIPSGAAAGTWVVSQITLTDNAGNIRTYSDLNALPITVTGNDVITASGFAASPNPVNNWGTFPTTELSMTVSGARQGISAVYVDDAQRNCFQSSTTPTLNPDGTVSVPLIFFENAPKCVITGIAVLDGAGDVALYGSEYGALDPGVTITQVPDTPPTISSASLNPTSVPSISSPQQVMLTMDIDNAVAPVDEVSVALFDSSGHQVLYGGGNTWVPDTSNGPLSVSFTVNANTPPGVYTVGFILFDVAGLHTIYGPGSGGQPVPGGPLQLTVTSS